MLLPKLQCRKRSEFILVRWFRNWHLLPLVVDDTVVILDVVPFDMIVFWNVACDNCFSVIFAVAKLAFKNGAFSIETWSNETHFRFSWLSLPVWLLSWIISSSLAFISADQFLFYEKLRNLYFSNWILLAICSSVLLIHLLETSSSEWLTGKCVIDT